MASSSLISRSTCSNLMSAKSARPSTTRNHHFVVSAAVPSPKRIFNDAVKQAAGAMLGTLAATSLLLAPLPAHAVSGGGGMGSSLAYKDLTGQDFRKSNFTKADLRGANFSGANLEGIRMFGAICADAKFVGANMRGTDLELSDLEGADFTNAVLEGALLTNAQLQRVKSIEGADFTDVLMRKDVMMNLCKIAKGTNPTTGVDTRESLFCP